MESPAAGQGILFRPFGKRKTAPVEYTPKVMRHLEVYLADKSNRSKAVQQLLGCSPRTADSIASRTKPYRSPMKLEWIVRVCEAVGITPARMLDYAREKEWQECTLGWAKADTLQEAIQMASDCAISIAYRAAQAGITGSFSVDYDPDGIKTVILFLSRLPHMRSLGGAFRPHRIIITADIPTGSSGRLRMQAAHVEPSKDTVLSKDNLTPKFIDSVLDEITAAAKDFIADTKDEERQRW